MLGESYAKELLKIPFAGKTVARRISDISEHLCDQSIDRLKKSRSELQVDGATDVVKDAYLITCVRYVWENDVKDILFCRPIDGRAVPLEVFNIFAIF
jgi:hypothetical protein